jgi:hypothetical protein
VSPCLGVTRRRREGGKAREQATAKRLRTSRTLDLPFALRAIKSAQPNSSRRGGPLSRPPAGCVWVHDPRPRAFSKRRRFISKIWAKYTEKCALYSCIHRRFISKIWAKYSSILKSVRCSFKLHSPQLTIPTNPVTALRIDAATTGFLSVMSLKIVAIFRNHRPNLSGQLPLSYLYTVQ